MEGVKRNWRSGSPPIYVPLQPIHLWWLLPIWVAIALAILTIVIGGLYLLIWSLV